MAKYNHHAIIKRSQRRSWAIKLLSAFLCLFLLASCSSSAEDKAGSDTKVETPAEKTEKPQEKKEKPAEKAAEAPAKTLTTVTDVTGASVELELPIDNAVISWTGSGGPFMTMSALLGENVADHIAGWDDSLIKNRADMYEAYVKTVPALADLPVVGTVNKDDFNFELVVTLDPDVLIFPLGLKEATDSTVAGKLAEAGIPVLYIDYHAETIENHTKSTLLLGQLFGKEERAQKIVDRYTSAMTDLSNRVTKAIEGGATPPRVYLEVGYKGPSEHGNSYGRTHMWGAMMEIAGADNVTGDSIAKWEPVTPEFVLDANPEVIVLTGSYWPKQPEALFMGFQATPEVTQGHLTAFAGRPGWNELDAIKNKRLHAVHHGMARELYDYTSVMALAKAFYPEEFADVDPRAELEAYYDEFLPYDLEGIWFEQWEG